MASGKTSSPQTWNRFSYVGNDPINLVDPTGLTWYSQVQENGDTVYRWFDSPPEDGWTQVENFVYNSNSESGWVALDPYSANHQSGFDDSGAASNVYRGSVEFWDAHQFITGANDALSPFTAFVRGHASTYFGIDPNINTTSTPYRGGWWTSVILEGTISTVAGAAALLSGSVAASGSNQIFQRVVSAAELEATEGNNLLRGGREGVNWFTNSASLDAKRAQIRLGLDGPLRDFRISFKIVDGTKVTGPEIAQAGASGTPGGGLQFYTARSTQIQILSVQPLKK